MFIVLGIAGLVAGVAVFGIWLARRRSRHGLPLAGTILLSFGALALVTGWVLAEGSINRGEALKTGGLAAGSVVALYALWLNDRRRRVEEQRQEIERKRQELEHDRYALEQRRQDLEHERAEHDRLRVADERFARSVELLGHEADQVRVGALHALAGLAYSRPGYRQTVLDVLCSYLRRPFDHPDYAAARGAEFDGDPEAADRERQVRRTAQQLISDLLPAVSTDEVTVAYDLDLHGATLEYFDISQRVVGQIRARMIKMYEANSFWGMRVVGSAWFTGSQIWGRFYGRDIVFEERCWFSRFVAHDEVVLSGCEFRGETKFANALFRGPVTFAGARFDQATDFTNTHFLKTVDLGVSGVVAGRTHGMQISLEHHHRLPEGWTVERVAGRSFGLVRAGQASYVAGQ